MPAFKGSDQRSEQADLECDEAIANLKTMTNEIERCQSLTTQVRVANGIFEDEYRLNGINVNVGTSSRGRPLAFSSLASVEIGPYSADLPLSFVGDRKGWRVASIEDSDATANITGSARKPGNEGLYVRPSHEAGDICDDSMHTPTITHHKYAPIEQRRAFTRPSSVAIPVTDTAVINQRSRNHVAEHYNQPPSGHATLRMQEPKIDIVVPNRRAQSLRHGPRRPCSGLEHRLKYGDETRRRQQCAFSSARRGSLQVRPHWRPPGAVH